MKPLSRRHFLTAAALGAGAAAMPGRDAVADGSRAPKHLIVLLAYGGWDTTYALDPKPGLSGIDAPDGTITEFGSIPVFTHASRPAVDSFFEAYGDRAAVVNGIQMQSIVHTDCSKRLLTGTASDANADMGSIVSLEHGADRAAPYLVLGPTAYTGPLASIATRAGTVNQIRALLTDSVVFPPVDPDMPVPFVPSDEEAKLIADYKLARAKRQQAIVGQLGANQRKFDDFISSLERSDVVKDFSDGFGSDFTFTLDVREQIRLGLDAIERDVTHSVHLEQAFASWDTHAGNAAQAALHEDLFDALTFLADELVARKLLDDTVVAVLSEMGRTPKMNAQAGKDHWPVTSALLFGGGVRHGAYGASTDDLTAGNVDFETGAASAEGRQLQYGNLAAGILELCGVDASEHLEGSEPFRAFLG